MNINPTWLFIRVAFFTAKKMSTMKK